MLYIGIYSYMHGMGYGKQGITLECMHGFTDISSKATKAACQWLHDSLLYIAIYTIKPFAIATIKNS